MMQAVVFDKDRNIRPYSKFKPEAEKITNISQKTWLRVEYDMARRQAVQGENFRQMQGDKDLYPYWVYRGVMDSRERPEHVALEGKVFLIGDPKGDKMFPPNDWNCRCSGEAVDQRYLDKNKVQVTTGPEADNLLQSDVDPQFRFNPAEQGILPKDGSYFQAITGPDALTYKDYGLPPADVAAEVADVIERAHESGSEIQEIGEYYAKKWGGVVTPINYKKKDSIMRKMKDELGNDVRGLKDSVRNTVVIPYSKLDEAAEELKKEMEKPSSPVLRVKIQDGPQFYGYKGVIVNIRTDNGLVAEMQINSPGMIYAKVGEEDALKVMTKEQFDEIAKKTGLPPGEGHHFYDKIRVIDPENSDPKELEERVELIEASRKYYEKFYGF